MTGDNNKIPLPPAMPSKVEQSAEQTDREFLKDDAWFDVDVSKDYLDFTEPYEPPKWTLSKDGIPFAPLGGIHALTGQSGHGKTMFFTQQMAAILKGEFGGMRYELSDRVPRPRVLYIDTEMEKDNTIAVKNRVCELIEWNPQQAQDDFRIVMLRETAEAIDRWRKTLRAIYEVRPTVVFIDGLLDVVDDFNKNEECQRIIYRCMQVATHYQCSVWCLVHQNPGNNTKLVGHLGSMLERKVTDVFACIKEINDKTGEITFKVEQKKARGRDVPAWKFRVLPVGSYGRPEPIEANSQHDADISIELIERCLREGAEDITWPAFGKDIQKVFRERGNIKGNDKLQECIKRAQNKRLIIPQSDDEREPGQRYPKYNLNID